MHELLRPRIYFAYINASREMHAANTLITRGYLIY